MYYYYNVYAGPDISGPAFLYPCLLNGISKKAARQVFKVPFITYKECLYTLYRGIMDVNDSIDNGFKIILFTASCKSPPLRYHVKSTV